MIIPTMSIAARAEERVKELDEILAELDLPSGRLSTLALMRVVVAVAARSELFDDLVVDDPDHRWWMTLHEAGNFDLRVLSWERNQASDWHDHGGSSGAYVVTSGSLRERYRADDGVSVSERLTEVGQPLAFGPSHVHDVTYDYGTPAVSVHAYSPPLVGLTFYDHSPLGFVARDVVLEESRRPFELAR
jgi:hypothetical protein